MNQERLMQVLLAPQISEKATYIAEKNEQVVFRVATDATKPEVKAAVELLFKVEVEAVRIANVKGKTKRFGRSMGKRKGWKKAYVSLKAGQEINFVDGGAAYWHSSKSIRLRLGVVPWSRSSMPTCTKAHRTLRCSSLSRRMPVVTTTAM